MIKAVKKLKIFQYSYISVRYCISAKYFVNLSCVELLGALMPY